MDIADPMPKTNLSLTPIGNAFAVVAANQVFKNMTAVTGNTALAQTPLEPVGCGLDNQESLLTV